VSRPAGRAAPAWLAAAAAAVTGAVAGGLAMIATALALRFFTGLRSGATAVSLLALGTTLGACIGGWALRPAIARLVSRRTQAGRPRRGPGR